MSSLRAEIWESRALMVSTFCVSSLASASASSASTFLRPSASFCSTSSCVSFFILLSAADISARAAFITAAPCSSSCFTSADVSFTLNRISAMIIGSVRLKSNSDAFSISSAIDGGATARAVPRITDRDFKLEERVRERNWLRFGSWGRVNLGREAEILSLGAGRAVGIRAFEEAMIILRALHHTKIVKSYPPVATNISTGVTTVDCQKQVRSWQLLRAIMEFLIPSCNCTFVEEDTDDENSSQTSDNYQHRQQPPYISSSTTTITSALFGYCRGKINFCIQTNSKSSSAADAAPLLLLELAVSTTTHAWEMHDGVLRIALESKRNGSLGMLLLSMPVWNVD
nr:protein MIZU-KUSSEI 1-like [Ipomoea batatas]